MKNKVKIVPPCEFSEQRKIGRIRKRKNKGAAFSITFMVQRNEKEGKQKIFLNLCAPDFVLSVEGHYFLNTVGLVFNFTLLSMALLRVLYLFDNDVHSLLILLSC